MYEFIKIQYQLGKLTKDQLENFVPKWITQDQADEILGGVKNE